MSSEPAKKSKVRFAIAVRTLRFYKERPKKPKKKGKKKMKASGRPPAQKGRRGGLSHSTNSKNSFGGKK